MKILLLSILLAGLTFSGTCQTPSQPRDTNQITVPTIKLRQLIRDREECKQLTLAMQKTQDDLTAAYTHQHDSIVNSFIIRDSLLTNSINAQSAQIKIRQDEFDLAQTRIQTLEKDLKREKWNTLKVGGIGILVSVTLLVLLVSK